MGFHCESKAPSIKHSMESFKVFFEQNFADLKETRCGSALGRAEIHCPMTPEKLHARKSSLIVFPAWRQKWQKEDMKMVLFWLISKWWELRRLYVKRVLFLFGRQRQQSAALWIVKLNSLEEFNSHDVFSSSNRFAMTNVLIVSAA